MVQTESKLTPEHVGKAYEALASGDRARISQYWAEDMVWLVPGHNPLSGWYYGLDGFLGFMGQVGDLSAHSFHMDAIVVMTNGEYSADVTHNLGFRAGYENRGTVPYTKLDIDVVHVLRWRDGRVIAGKGAIMGDGTTQYDQFWSPLVGAGARTSDNGRSAPSANGAAQSSTGSTGGASMQQTASTGAMAVVDRMYQCFAKGDMDTLAREVFATDIEWALPGHHPLSGVKRGANEVIAFFAALQQTGVNVTDISFGTIGNDTVVERHTGHGKVNGREYLFPTCSNYTIRDGKIAHVQVYTADQHGVDDYFWQAYELKPLPDRLAR
jgi:ketosteroid isomerase-like protein